MTLGGTHSQFMVPPPFNDEGDCILQTHGGVQFKVFRCILSLASPVFKDMLTLGKIAEKPEDAETPVIPVGESPEILHLLLSSLYPNDQTSISDFSVAFGVIDACDKYDISVSRITPLVNDLLRAPDQLTAYGLRAYALAWRLGDEHAARKASRYTHGADLGDRSSMSRLVRQSGDIRSLLALYDLRQRREQALDAMVEELQPFRYVCRAHENDAAKLRAYRNLKERLREALAQPYPVCHSRDPATFLDLSADEPLVPEESCYDHGRSKSWPTHYGQCFQLTDEIDNGIPTLSELVSTFPQEITGFERNVTPKGSPKAGPPIAIFPPVLMSDTVTEARGDSERDLSTFQPRAPFDMESPGDCILRARCGAQFKVLRHILSIASPIFSDMFSVPQPAVQPSSKIGPDELPVIDLTETAEVIQELLRVLYPMDKSQVRSIDVAFGLIDACEKYEVPLSSVQAIVRGILDSMHHLGSSPLEVYALAWRLKMKKEAVTASRYTHPAALTSAYTVEKLVRQSGSVQSLTALYNLRFRRERSILDMVHRLYAWHKVYLCHTHSLDPDVASSRVQELESRLRKALDKPYPSCTEFHTFFALTAPWNAHKLRKKYQCWGMNPSCYGFDGSVRDSFTLELSRLVSAHPQAITGFDD
ncbi:hypothetical protein FRB99_004923 [Tulasnella sp. 403]|nr:hypothetical protein FRB99_004923 [Tulasnella sp. 403]